MSADLTPNPAIINPNDNFELSDNITSTEVRRLIVNRQIQDAKFCSNSIRFL